MLRYYQHFGLQRDPFLDTSDPQFYLELPAVRRNLRSVLNGVEESRGLTVVIGPPGAGKTSLSSSVEQVLLGDESVVIGKILDPTFASEIELLVAISRVFGLDLKSHSAAALKNALKNYFFDEVVENKRTLVLLIDEAQNLSSEGLETLRLLLNFQIPQKKLLNVVLFGQEEFEQLLVAHDNFNDRVDRYVRIEPLDVASSASLIEHRLRRAGKSPTAEILSPEALSRAIAGGSGLPRRLANIVRGAMIEAADRGAEIVRPDHVIAALRSRRLRPAERNGNAAQSVSGEIDLDDRHDGTSYEEQQHEKPRRHLTLMGRLLAWLP
jgi:general secretion pathway protein A